MLADSSTSIPNYAGQKCKTWKKVFETISRDNGTLHVPPTGHLKNWIKKKGVRLQPLHWTRESHSPKTNKLIICSWHLYKISLKSELPLKSYHTTNGKQTDKQTRYLQNRQETLDLTSRFVWSINLASRSDYPLLFYGLVLRALKVTLNFSSPPHEGCNFI